MKKFELRKIRLTILILFLSFNTSLHYASTTKLAKFSTNEVFKKGKCDKISIASDGQLLLSPKTQTFFDSGEPFLWSWAQDSKANIYVGSGNDGKVFKIDTKGNSQVFFDAEELEVYALTIDKRDNIFIATSPGGKIYKVQPSGKSEIYFDPPDKYIWSLVFNKKGELFAATGDSGIIYKITAPQNGTIFYDSDELHIRILHLDKDGNLLAGSVANGLLFQISPNGEAFVLFDTPFREIHSITHTEDGTLYIGAFGKEIGKLPVREAAIIPKTEEKKSSEQEYGPELPEIRIEAERLPSSQVRFIKKDNSAVYRLTSEGAVQNIWKFKSEAVYSMILDHDGTLVIGTGMKGNVYRLTSDGEEILLFSRDESQITALSRDKSNRIYLCSSNMGKLILLDNSYETSGTYESDILSVNNVSQWGNVSWKADVPQGASLELFTRSGNTAKADQTWSSWSKAYSQSEGQNITSPSSRYLQWKAEFKTSKKSQTPILKEVSIAYLQKNLSPVIIDLKVKTPEESYREQQVEDETEYYERSSRTRPIPQPRGISSERKPAAIKGKYTISWYADDDNNDQLEFDIYYKGKKEINWKLLKEKQKRSRYSLDGQQLPDGTYLVKVVAKDTPSNPANLSKKAEKISEPFDIDNTGPEIKNLQVKQLESNQVEITYQVTDQMFPILKLEYVIDVGDWQLIYPNDQICDSKTETFQLKSDKLSKGKHTIVIRAHDRLTNIGFGKFHFEVN